MTNDHLSKDRDEFALRILEARAIAYNNGWQPLVTLLDSLRYETQEVFEKLNVPGAGVKIGRFA